MPYRLNGIGTTISPIPDKGAVSISMLWFTFLFIPIMPLGLRLIKGVGEEKYCILESVSFSDAKKELGKKGLWLTIVWGYFSGLIMLIAFGCAILFLIFLRQIF